MKDSTSTWLKCFDDGFRDEDVIVVNNGKGPESGAIERAAANIIFEERRYLEQINDINDFVPTRDTNSVWLQCFANNGCRITENNIDSTTIRRRLVPSHKGLTQAELDHDYLREQGIACGMEVGKWMIKTTEDHVDEMWCLLATALLDGTLRADSVKCATRRNARRGDTSQSQKCRYTVCVYTNNGLADRDSVMQLREALHDLNIEQKCICPMYWKPDLYTLLPLSGTTYLWIDGVDTTFWRNHWGNNPLKITGHPKLLSDSKIM